MKLFPWLNHQYSKIINRYQSGKGHNSLLIHSNDGNGELLFIKAISIWLMCTQKKKKDIIFCKKCLSCKLMINSKHPDFFYFSKIEYQHSIGIDIIRNLVEKLYIYSYIGGTKVVCFPSSELLTEESVNSLLKIIEESPFNTFFIFCYQEFIPILPTLYSRCLYCKLLPPKKKWTINWLKSKVDFNIEKINSALYISNNYPLKALSLLQPESWKIRCNLYKILEKSIIDFDFFNLLPLLNPDQNNIAILWLLSLISDVIKYQQGAKKFIKNNDQLKLIKKISFYWNIILLHKNLKKWFKFYFNCILYPKIDKELFLIDRLLDWINNPSFKKKKKFISIKS